ncbi:MAG: hypothetical protein E7Z99_04040 [Coriobacteriaceae bacterium]|nr:hypothetical protein [Coriobacteriaceae bacterium]
MRKRLVNYRRHVDEMLEDDAPDQDWEEAIEEHLVQVSFFQHERLVHLLVTLAFALMTIVSAAAVLLFPRLLTGILTLLFLVLLVPYIVHYYFLENETQKLYAQYDRLLGKARRSNRTSPRETDCPRG